MYANRLLALVSEPVRLLMATFGVLLLVEVGVACGGDAADPSSFEGVPWVLSSGVDVEGWETVAPSAQFADGKVAGSTGCNRYGGPYTADGDTIEFGQISSTKRACPPPADAVERAYVAALEQVARWRTDDEELVLLGQDGDELLRYSAATLVGSWQATAFVRGDSVSSPIAGTEITASFAEDGALTGSSGCNTYTTTYTIEHDTIEIPPAAITRKLCPEPAGVMEQEAAYLAALAEAERFIVGGGLLELQRADGRVVAAFAAAD